MSCDAEKALSWCGKGSSAQRQSPFRTPIQSSWHTKTALRCVRRAVFSFSKLPAGASSSAFAISSPLHFSLHFSAHKIALSAARFVCEQSARVCFSPSGPPALVCAAEAFCFLFARAGCSCSAPAKMYQIARPETKTANGLPVRPMLFPKAALILKKLLR